MDSNKLITAGALERFKGQQDIENALRFLARIVYPSLPTDCNYDGRLCFQTSDNRLYIYTSSDGWRRLLFEDEISGGSSWLDIDEDGALMPKEAD